MEIPQNTLSKSAITGLAQQQIPQSKGKIHVAKSDKYYLYKHDFFTHPKQGLKNLTW